jgi:hypothetical protein
MILDKACKPDGVIQRFGLSLMAKDNLQEMNPDCRPKFARISV